MKLTDLRVVSSLFVGFVVLSGACGWYFYSTLRTVEKELPVEKIAKRPEQSAMITSLSRVSTALEAVRVEPTEGKANMPPI